MQYIYNLGLGLDQFINCLLLGDPDESISGRTGRAALSGRPKWWVPYLHVFIDRLVHLLVGQSDHCINSVEPEEIPYSKELWRWIKD